MRHQDTCQYKKTLEADISQVRCPKHRMVTTAEPWAEPSFGVMILFEALVTDCLKEASIAHWPD